MAEPIIMPRQGQSVESCILTEWKVNVGDQVAEGDVLAVIETDKASFDLESTAAGTVLALFWEADDDVPVLANVAVVGSEGEDVEEFKPAGGASSAPEPSPATEAPAVASPAAPVAETATTVASPAPAASNDISSAGVSAGVSPVPGSLPFVMDLILKPWKVQDQMAG